MNFAEAMTQQPAWVGWWLNWLLIGAFLLPLVLLIWRPSRMAGFLSLLASVIAGALINLMFQYMGHVKLLGLPHILLWVPLLFYLNAQQKRLDMPYWPRRIIYVVMATLLISLAFDTIATMQYLLGDRTPMLLTS